AQQTWTERGVLSDLVTSAASRKRRLASRNFELMANECTNPERSGLQMLPRLTKAIGNSTRTLVIWAATSDHWLEASYIFDRLPVFSCLMPPAFSMQHARMEQRIPVPRPGILNWSAFSEDLKKRLASNFENVIVCHTANP